MKKASKAKLVTRMDVCLAAARTIESGYKANIRSKAKPNLVHELFAVHLQELGLRFEQEVQVSPDRKWRWDFVFWTEFGQTGKSVNRRWAVEIDGYFKGRHGTGWGADNEKQNIGVLLKWNPLRFSTNSVKDGSAKAWILKHLLRDCVLHAKEVQSPPYGESNNSIAPKKIGKQNCGSSARRSRRPYGR